MDSIEKKLERLEEISKLLDKNPGLDEAISLFDESVKISTECENYINKAEEKIKKIKESI